jgi:acetyl esterase/lipase
MEDQELEQLLVALRSGGPDLSGPPAVARVSFEAMMAGMPVAEDLAFEAVTLGGRPALRVAPPGTDADRQLLYLHGGAYVFGSPQAYRGLGAEIARAAHAQGWILDYRLAPESPCPAAIEDALAAYRGLLEGGAQASDIVIAGDSAGGGLTLALLVAARDAGLPMPAAALLLCPWADLACAGETMASKAAEDPSLTPESLAAMAALYLAGRSAISPEASPLYADLRGLPPLLIQVGSSEVLLSDATRLAAAAGAAGVEVTLRVWPRMVHVWHSFGFMLGAGRRATAEAGAFLAAHLHR